jgi:hypothetical protein
MVIERIANVDTPQITNAPKYAEIIPIKKITASSIYYFLAKCKPKKIAGKDDNTV